MCLSSEKRREERSFHSVQKSESAAVGSVAAIEEAFHDESRHITGRDKPEILDICTFLDIYQHNSCRSHSTQHIRQPRHFIHDLHAVKQ